MVAAWSKNKKEITIAVVNPTKNYQTLPIQTPGSELKKTGKHWIITGNNEMDYNEPGKEALVKIVEKVGKIKSGELKIAPFSINLYSFPIN